MNEEQLSIQDIQRRHRIHCYPDPTWSLWAASQLLSGNHAGQAQQWAILTGAHLLRQAAPFSPYDLSLFGLIQQLEPHQPAPKSTREWLDKAQAVTRRLHVTNQQDSLNFIDKLRGHVPEIRKALAGQLAINDRFLCLIELWRLGERDVFIEECERFMSIPGAELAAPVLAFAAWRSGQRERAAAMIDSVTPNYLVMNLRAEWAFEDGDTNGARDFWRESLSMEPLQPALVYKLRDTMRPAVDSSLVENARVHVGFYTFNKLDVTLETLGSLLASRIDPAKITLLNNGSTAFSPEELDAGVARTAQGRAVDVVHLPTNVGAPAARNWLRTMPATRESDYLAYLDDDVFLPEDWLARFLQNLQSHPEAVVAGPLGMNPGEIPTVQYVWRFFDEVGDGKIRFSNNCPQFMDMGQYDSLRPCLSVMGCCHLFDLSRWNALGVPDFDIRFSPSQVDDLEHDIQVWKAGGQAIYDGQVRVVHRQDAGKAAPMSRAAWGSVISNHNKMEAKLSGAELAHVDSSVRGVDQQYWEESVAAVAEMLPPGCKRLLAAYGASSV